MTTVSSILLRNVRVFDGVRAELSAAQDVRVEGEQIVSIAPSPDEPAAESPAADVVIDGAGRTLMPGLIDMHTHLAFAGISQVTALTADAGLVTIAAAVGAEQSLLRGFTSVRDLGGPVLGLKQAIDAGLTAVRASSRRGRSSPSPAVTATSGCRTRCRAARTATSATPS